MAEWLDCGNKDATVDTNARVLAFASEDGLAETLISEEADLDDALIIEPCFIGKGAVITHSVVGPYVSVGEYAIINQSIIRNSIIQANAKIDGKMLQNSMIGQHAKLTGHFEEMSLGDFNELID